MRDLTCKFVYILHWSTVYCRAAQNLEGSFWRPSCMCMSRCKWKNLQEFIQLQVHLQLHLEMHLDVCVPGHTLGYFRTCTCIFRCKCT